MTAQLDKKCRKILLITSSGGSGHTQAAKAKAAKALSESPETVVIQRDILINWAGKCLGKWSVYIWNASQRKGNFKILSFFSKSIPIADVIFWVRIFYKALFTIIREDIDQIIDTQPIGTAAIIKAIKLARFFTNKSLLLEKVITELPTEKVLHFFKPIKKLPQADRKILCLVSTTPLLRHNQTPDAFWLKNCGLKEKEVRYEALPLRPMFEHYRALLNAPFESMTIEIKVNNHIERTLIADTIKRGKRCAQIYPNKIGIPIEPDDRVSTILLGSQPTEEATLKYVKGFIEMATKAGNHGFSLLLFVFCNHESEHRNSLLRRVYDVIQKVKTYPDHLTIIPMCFQEDEVIAPLYYRSDATLTRSGGLTSMELLSVAQGQLWIHSEIEGTVTPEKLYKGMPIWERGNADYLREKKGAQLITPETFSDCCSPLFMPEPPTASSLA